jgi:peptide chain release factor 1
MSSGPGPRGQSVNTTDSAVRITHSEWHRGVAAGSNPSSEQDQGDGVLRARLLDRMISEQESARAAERRAMVGTGVRS